VTLRFPNNTNPSPRQTSSRPSNCSNSTISPLFLNLSFKASFLYPSSVPSPQHKSMALQLTELCQRTKKAKRQMELLPLPLHPRCLSTAAAPTTIVSDGNPYPNIPKPSNPYPTTRLTIKIHRLQMNPSRYQQQHLWMLMVTMLNSSNNNIFSRLYPPSISSEKLWTAPYVQISKYGIPELSDSLDAV
jgi:hypothetical protein